jgi:hypothetical protein
LGDALVLGALIVGAAAPVAFLVLEGRGREPMMPLSLFRSRNFTLLLYFALYGILYFPSDLIWVHGYSATAAGATIVPTFLLMSVLSRYTGARLPLVLGPAITALSFALFVVAGVGRGSYWTGQRRTLARRQETGGGPLIPQGAPARRNIAWKEVAQ